MPKVELHVHLEGSIRPETVLKLAQRSGIQLPASDVESLRDWYRFRDFTHFVEVYVAVSKCIRSPEDLHLIMSEFLQGQADQNVLHSEVTYTHTTIERYCGIPWKEQHPALLQAMREAEDRLGITCGLVLDIVRGGPVELASRTADDAVASKGVVALGLAGDERLGTSQYSKAFETAHEAGLPIVPHAGETVGPESVRDVLEHCAPLRIGHGVRSMEDHGLVKELVERQIPLEVCPSSNVRLGVYPSLAEHPLPRMLDEGLNISINSDDPPMFGTTVTDEFLRCSDEFELNEDVLYSLTLNAARAALISEEARTTLVTRIRQGFTDLMSQEQPG